MLGFALRFASNGARAYSPRVLFTQGQQGAWYDPSDLSTLFQDAAGTIPVTATGQPVGLMRDKSGRGNHATQATAASRPIFRDVGGLRYLECDGVDDWMVTGNVDFTGTDKMLVCAGVRKLSDTARGVLLELSAVANSGAFVINSPVAAIASYGATFRGTTVNNMSVDVVGAGYAAPDTDVLTVQGDLGAATANLRMGGVQAATSTGVVTGGGNFGTYPLYLFRRGGTTLPFTGLFYGAVIAGAAYSASQIASAERYLAGKSGVTL